MISPKIQAQLIDIDKIGQSVVSLSRLLEFIQYLMIQQDNIQLKQITNLFYNASYHQGRAQISTLIEQYPCNSMLYTNRALFSSQMGQDQYAIQDLEKALEIDPFNYIAYFNYFSILARNNQDEEAFRSICCSLSCMYLLKAKGTQQIIFAEKALQYAENNIGAQILRATLTIKQKYESTALNKQQLQKMAALMAQSKIDIFNKFSINKQSALSNLKLNCSVVIETGSNLQKEIDKKVKEFNLLYGQLNNKFGIMTQRVPKGSEIQISPSIFSHSHSHASGSSKISVIAMLEDEEYFEDLKNEELKDKLKSQQQNYNPQYLKKVMDTANKPTSTQSFVDINEVIVQKESELQSQKSDKLRSSAWNPKAYSLYPLQPHYSLNFGLINFQFEDPPLQDLKHVYCIITYDNERVKFVSDPTECSNSYCSWNQRYGPFLPSPTPSTIRVKLFNKVFNNRNDFYMGQIEVILDIVDLMKLPIYNKSGHQIGEIMLHITLISKETNVQ